MLKSIVGFLSALLFHYTLVKPAQVTKEDAVKEPQKVHRINILLSGAKASIWALYLLFILNQSMQVNQPWSKRDIISVLGILGGAGLRLWAMTKLGRYYTFDLAIRKEHKLIYDGPYRYLRHPSYTGLLLTLAGYLSFMLKPSSNTAVIVSDWTGLGTQRFVTYIAPVLGYVLKPNWFVTPFLSPSVINTIAVAVFSSAVYVVKERIKNEEHMLKEEFKDDWDQFCKTRKKLIPFVY